MNSSSISVHDIKETVKRTARFAYIAIFFAAITAIANIIYGNILSASLVGGLMACFFLILFLNFKGFFSAAKITSVLSVNIFLTIISFAEGLRTGGYLFFIPLLSVLPYLIDNHERYLEELSAYLALSIACFCICIFYVPERSNWQVISEGIYERMFLNNCISAILMSASFAVIGLFMERKYVRTIIKQKKKTEEASQARARFLSNMGHELRTPLNGIIGASNLLEKEASLPHQQEYLNILKYCSDHMLRLVNDILDFNKIEAGKLNLHPVEFNLKTLLEKSTIPFYNHFEDKGIKLKVSIDKKLDEVVVHDDLRLVQILNNILSNALKFTSKGSVELTAKLLEEKSDHYNVHFSIKDSGIGIALKDQYRIFESFWQVYSQSSRKFGGTGLGLTISQRLLEMMNSRLQVRSEEGKGSEFFFDIDLKLCRCKSKEEALAVEGPSDLAGYKVLLAEDNVINMLIAKKMLEDWNAEVVTAMNGAEALKLLEKDCNYNIILLDLEMPEVDGYTAMKAIKKLYPELPVIAFTAALMDNEMIQKLLNLGFVDCVLKPFKPQELLAKMKSVALPASAVKVF